jgi:membrane protease YdiL (CAAX protease family)
MKASNHATFEFGGFGAMKSFIRNLPTPVEFVIVVSLWLDPLLLNGCFVLKKFIHSGFWEVGNAYLIRGAIFTLAALAVIAWIGNIRGWPLSTLGIKISWRGTGGGILLAGLAYAASYSVWTIYELFFPRAHLDITVTRLAIPVIISSQIIDAVFEEVVGAGYFIQRFSQFGMSPAILASALLRTFYHVPWVGTEGLMGIFAACLIIGYAYWRWRQLWPLILAHTLRNSYFLFFALHHAA